MNHVLLPLKPSILIRPLVPSQLSARRFCFIRFPAIRTYSTSQKKDGLSPVLSTIYTLPNILTFSRIAAAPLIGHYILSQNLTPALCLFTYSCLTDFLDGYLARKYKMKSVLGTILDPMADKILMLVTTISLAFPPGPQLIPLPVAGLILGRDFMLSLSALYFRFASMKHTYGRVAWSSFWNFFRYPSAEVKPTQISKWNTFLQMIYLGWGVIAMILNSRKNNKGLEEEKQEENMSMKGFTWMGYLVCTTTVLSGASYLFSKDAVKFLKRVK